MTEEEILIAAANIVENQPVQDALIVAEWLRQLSEMIRAEEK